MKTDYNFKCSDSLLNSKQAMKSDMYQVTSLISFAMYSKR